MADLCDGPTNLTNLQQTPTTTQPPSLTNESLDLIMLPMIVISVVISVITVTGNVVVMVMIVKRGLMGRCVCIFVASTAMSDVIQGMLVLPVEVVNVFVDLELASYFCKLQFYFMYISKTCAFYTLCLYAAIKTYSMLLSSSGYCISAGRCMFFVSFIWLFSASYNIWTIVFYTSHPVIGGRVTANYPANLTGASLSSLDDIGQQTLQMYVLNNRTQYSNQFNQSENLINTEFTTNNVYVTTSSCSLEPRFLTCTRIFAFVDIFIIFLFPIVFLCVLILVPYCKMAVKKDVNLLRKEIQLPMTLLIVYVGCQLPWEVVHFVVVYSDYMWRSLYLTRFVLIAILCTRGFINVIIYYHFRKSVTRKKGRCRRATLDVPDMLALRRHKDSATVGNASVNNSNVSV